MQEMILEIKQSITVHRVVERCAQQVLSLATSSRQLSAFDVLK